MSRWNRFWRLPGLQCRRNDICRPKGRCQIPHDHSCVNGHCLSRRKECGDPKRTNLPSRGRIGWVHNHEKPLEHRKVIWRLWAGPELQDPHRKEEQGRVRFLELQLRHNRVTQSCHDIPSERYCAGLAGTIDYTS